MTRWRVGLAQFLAIVAVLAIGLGMMKAATEWLARGVILSAFVALLTTTIGSFVRPRDRPTWIGFTVFGWGYCLLVVASAFMSVYSRPQRDPAEIWRVADLAEYVANQMHPDLPMLPDPFPRTSIAFDPKTGRRSKSGENQNFVPMTTEETRAQVDYEAQTARCRERSETSVRALYIGLTIQGLAFSMLGGGIGQTLSADGTKNKVWEDREKDGKDKGTS